MNALRDESGFTLTEVLVVSLMMIVVLGAVLGAFESFASSTERNRRLNDVQDSVRVSIDALTRELRNLASPTNELPQAVQRATTTDLVWLSVAGNKPAGSLNVRNARLVRYCQSAGAVKKLWRQELTWTSATAPSTPSDLTCPGTGWTSNRVMANYVVNGTRPIFTYNSATLTDITEVGVALYVDADPGHSPKEVTLQSAVFLRNQNRVPEAVFSATVSGGTIVLNASDSIDPEGRALDFYWYDPGKSGNATGCGTLPSGVPASGCIGKGLTYTYTPPAAGSWTVYLVAVDPAGLTNQASSQTKCVPGAGVPCP
ncbi:MAG TPA: type II secretion system protein [Thermoleophilaceae bacterium]